MVLRKTWCHGQVVAPAFGLLCLIWFAHHPSLWLLYAGIVLPAWSYVSYRNVFGTMRPVHLVAGGVAVELAYLAVLLEALPGAKDRNDPSRAWYTMLCIGSGLLAFETLAFLVVALTIHGTAAASRSDYRDLASSTTTTNRSAATPSRGTLL